jgi:hypothetical protein
MKQRRLARAVGAEYANELTGMYGHAYVREDHPSRSHKRHPIHFDREHV